MCVRSSIHAALKGSAVIPAAMLALGVLLPSDRAEAKPLPRCLIEFFQRETSSKEPSARAKSEAEQPLKDLKLTQAQVEKALTFRRDGGAWIAVPDDVVTRALFDRLGIEVRSYPKTRVRTDWRARELAEAQIPAMLNDPKVPLLNKRILAEYFLIDMESRGNRYVRDLSEETVFRVLDLTLAGPHSVLGKLISVPNPEPAQIAQLLSEVESLTRSLDRMLEYYASRAMQAKYLEHHRRLNAHLQKGLQLLVLEPSAVTSEHFNVLKTVRNAPLSFTEFAGSPPRPIANPKGFLDYIGYGGSLPFAVTAAEKPAFIQWLRALAASDGLQSHEPDLARALDSLERRELLTASERCQVVRAAMGNPKLDIVALSSNFGGADREFHHDFIKELVKRNVPVEALKRYFDWSRVRGDWVPELREYLVGELIRNGNDLSAWNASGERGWGYRALFDSKGPDPARVAEVAVDLFRKSASDVNVRAEFARQLAHLKTDDPQRFNAVLQGIVPGLLEVPVDGAAPRTPEGWLKTAWVAALQGKGSEQEHQVLVAVENGLSRALEGSRKSRKLTLSVAELDPNRVMPSRLVAAQKSGLLRLASGKVQVTRAFWDRLLQEVASPEESAAILASIEDWSKSNVDLMEQAIKVFKRAQPDSKVRNELIGQINSRRQFRAFFDRFLEPPPRTLAELKAAHQLMVKETEVLRGWGQDWQAEFFEHFAGKEKLVFKLIRESHSMDDITWLTDRRSFSDKVDPSRLGALLADAQTRLARDEPPLALQKAVLSLDLKGVKSYFDRLYPNQSDPSRKLRWFERLIGQTQAAWEQSEATDRFLNKVELGREAFGRYVAGLSEAGDDRPLLPDAVKGALVRDALTKDEVSRKAYLDGYLNLDRNDAGVIRSRWKELGGVHYWDYKGLQPNTLVHEWFVAQPVDRLKRVLGTGEEAAIELLQRIEAGKADPVLLAQLMTFMGEHYSPSKPTRPLEKLFFRERNRYYHSDPIVMEVDEPLLKLYLDAQIGQGTLSFQRFNELKALLTAGIDPKHAREIEIRLREEFKKGIGKVDPKTYWEAVKEAEKIRPGTASHEAVALIRSGSVKGHPEFAAHLIGHQDEVEAGLASVLDHVIEANAPPVEFMDQPNPWRAFVRQLPVRMRKEFVEKALNSNKTTQKSRNQILEQLQDEPGAREAIASWRRGGPSDRSALLDSAAGTIPGLGEMLSSRRDEPSRNLHLWIAQGSYERQGRSLMRPINGARGTRQIESDAEVFMSRVDEAFHGGALSGAKPLERRLFYYKWAMKPDSSLIESMRQRAIRIAEGRDGAQDFYDLRVEIHNFPTWDTIRRVEAFLAGYRGNEGIRRELVGIIAEMKTLLGMNETGTKNAGKWAPLLSWRLDGIASKRKAERARLEALLREPLPERGASGIAKSYERDRALSERAMSEAAAYVGSLESGELATSPKNVFAIGKRILEQIEYDNLLTREQAEQTVKSLEKIAKDDEMAESERIENMSSVLAGALDQVHMRLRADYGAADEALAQRFMDEEGRAHPVRFIDDTLRSQNTAPLGRLLDHLHHAVAGRRSVTLTVAGQPRKEKIEVLNAGRAQGVLRFNPDPMSLTPGDIAVFEKMPGETAPVGGIVTLGMGARLSHLQLLAKSLAIPNAKFSREYVEVLKAMDGKRVQFVTDSEGNVTLGEAGEATGPSASSAATATIQVPEPDHGQRMPVSFSAAAASVRPGKTASIAGPKGMTLALLRRDPKLGSSVPDGFVVPFGYFDLYAEQAGIKPWIELLRQTKVKNQYLVSILSDRIIQAIESQPIPDELLDHVMKELAGLQARRTGHAGGFFFRSDTNIEDLAGFNGAGLNESVPNVKVDRKSVEKAIRDVWMSPFREKSIQWRALALSTDKVAIAEPSVVVMPTVAAESSGVITSRGGKSWRVGRGAISANWGIGSVVQAGAPVEEISLSGATPVRTSFTSSTQKPVPSASGGLEMREVPSGGVVLTDAQIAELNAKAAEIERVLGPEPHGWDIEWAIDVQGRVWILQARPNM